MTAHIAKVDKSNCFGGYSVIDADTHLTEPHDLWTKIAPAKYKDRVPQVKNYNGKMSWVIDGDKCIEHGASPHSTIRKDGTKSIGYEFMKWTIDDCHVGSWRVKERLEMMDSYGIGAQIVYPNLLGFGGQKAAMVDFDLRLVCVKLYNDAMAQLQADSGQRLFPMALLPWWDIKESAKEAKRTAEMGLRGININADPHKKRDADGNALPDLNNPAWDALWDVCTDFNLPINFHIGNSEEITDWYGDQAWPSMDLERFGIIGSSMLFFNNSRVMANLLMGGLLDRFPKLKFVSVESGIGWIPFLLQSLDYQCLGVYGASKLKRMPSEYFRTNIFACFWFERQDLSHMIKTVGVDNILFETDFPHPTCLYPIDNVEQAMKGMNSSEIQKVLSGNASKLYNIKI